MTRFCADVLVQIGVALQSLGDSSRALELYADALQVHPQHDVALFEMAVLAMEQGRRADAIAFYRRAVQANPANIQVLLARGISRPNLPHGTMQAATVRRGHVQAWTNLGAMLCAAGALEDALEAFKHALSRAPAHRVVLANLAALHAAIGNAAAAPAVRRAEYERALAYDAGNADALYGLGVLEAAEEGWERAIFYYSVAVRAAPRHALAWNNLGVVYQKVDNLPCAVACYEAAVAARPDFALAHNNLGVIFTAQGHSGKAERHLRAAIAANPMYPEAHNNMGVLLRDRGLVAEVRPCSHHGAAEATRHAPQPTPAPARRRSSTTKGACASARRASTRSRTASWRSTTFTMASCRTCATHTQRGAWHTRRHWSVRCRASTAEHGGARRMAACESATSPRTSTGTRSRILRRPR
jgi:tetratricopeptide (TPR) repeat protein